LHGATSAFLDVPRDALASSAASVPRHEIVDRLNSDSPSADDQRMEALPPRKQTSSGPYRLQASGDPERPWQILTAHDEQVFAFTSLDYQRAVEMLTRLNSKP
jgi:hypothetical protein